MFSLLQLVKVVLDILLLDASIQPDIDPTGGLQYAQQLVTVPVSELAQEVEPPVHTESLLLWNTHATTDG